MDKRLDLAPESMMLFIFSFYVLLIDLVVYIVNFTRRRRFGVFIFLIVTVLVYYYSPYVNFNLKHYKLDKNNASSILQGSQRLSFDRKICRSEKKDRYEHNGQTYPIILITERGVDQEQVFGLVRISSISIITHIANSGNIFFLSQPFQEVPLDLVPFLHFGTGR
jgi:hypothetical protein